MGLLITKTEDEKYTLTSTISDGNLHDEDTVSLEEAKAIMVRDKYMTFMTDAIEIDMTFPHGLMVNGKRTKPSMDFHDWYGKILREDNWEELINERFKKIKF